jgi:hypothetical protein
VIYFVLAVGALAALTGWRHPDPETRAMCRATGLIAAVIVIFMWGS